MLENCQSGSKIVKSEVKRENKKEIQNYKSLKRDQQCEKRKWKASPKLWKAVDSTGGVADMAKFSEAWNKSLNGRKGKAKLEMCFRSNICGTSFLQFWKLFEITL